MLHTPEEPADGYPGTPHWFAQPHPGKEGSTHYFVSFHGFMYQCVRESVGAIANGVLNKPYPAWANPAVSLNRQSTNIEIEGYAATIGQTMPRGSGQWKALIDWIVFECRKWNIPCDRAHIIGHYEVSSNRSDPGTLNINAVVQDAQAAMEDDMALSQDDKRFIADTVIAILRSPEFDLDAINVNVKALMASPPGGLSEAQVKALINATKLNVP